MFIGHFGLALALKRAAPRTSLGTLALATEFADLLWPGFLLAGIEHVRIAPGITKVTPLDFYDYPISHSLLTDAGWAAAAGALYFAIRRSARGAWILIVAVLSHWLLDFVVHRPDMPLYPGGKLYFGLSLWNSVGATVAVELPIFVAGLCLYLTSTRAKDWVGRYGFWSVLVLLMAIWASSLKGMPPPSLKALELMALSLWLPIAWLYWADHHREHVRPSAYSISE